MCRLTTSADVLEEETNELESAVSPISNSYNTEQQVESSVLVMGSYGLHARPAGKLVKATQDFQSEIYLISSSGQIADARSILDVLSLAVKKNEELKVRCKGSDAKSACDFLCELLRSSLS